MKLFTQLPKYGLLASANLNTLQTVSVEIFASENLFYDQGSINAIRIFPKYFCMTSKIV